ncbi:hypothetical protein [Streptomyces montanisoli]|uniref:Uncharacterized protein n=1 Tax=Streptomyces montanisoli TaxID=2798581 RepID=A0A940MEM1_9ACTN|nr:hypothetical protein [Streptomyces montanisoli]MBP0457711.1 hypothetical protein [Streptomyces montanisoli]
MARVWEADPAASFRRRLGKSPQALEVTEDRDGCPDIWELDNGDIAVIGHDLTDVYAARLPTDATIAEDERLVVIPGRTLRAAKRDIADA